MIVSILKNIFFSFLVFVSSVSSQLQPADLGQSLKNEIFFLKKSLERIEKKIEKRSDLGQKESRDFLYKFQRVVRMRINEWIQNFESLSHSLSKPILKEKFYTKELLISFASAVLFFILARGLTRFSLSQKRVLSGSLKRTHFFTFVIFLPALAGLLFSAFFGIILFPGSGLFASKKGLSFFVTLPFHFYFSWSIFLWTEKVFLSKGSKNILSSPRTPDARRVSFWLRSFGICYFFSTAFLSISQALLSWEARRMRADSALMDLGFFLCTVCLVRGFSLLAKQIPDQGRIFGLQRLFVLLKWVVVLSFLFWFLEKETYFHLLPLFLMTAVAVWGARIIEQRVRKIRLSILWSRRHRPFFLRPLFRSRTWLFQSVQACIWLFLLKMWLSSFDRSSFFYMPFSLRTLSSTLTTLFSISVIVFIAHTLAKGADRILSYYIKENSKVYKGKNHYLSKRLETLMSMVKTLTRLLVWIPALSAILGKILSLDVRAWITGISLGSFGLAFGMQQLVRDFATGFFVILENNLMVGDEVDVDRYRGVVESISMRTLKIRTDYGMLLTIPFGTIHIIGNKNRSFSAFIVNISVGYNEDPDRIRRLVEEAFTRVRSELGRKVQGSIDIRGMQEVTSYSIVFQAKIKTAPNAQDAVRYAFNRFLKEVFDREGIFVPKAPHAVDRALPSLTNTICKERGIVGEALS